MHRNIGMMCRCQLPRLAFQLCRCQVVWRKIDQIPTQIGAGKQTAELRDGDCFRADKLVNRRFRFVAIPVKLIGRKPPAKRQCGKIFAVDTLRIDFWFPDRFRQRRCQFGTIPNIGSGHNADGHIDIAGSVRQADRSAGLGRKIMRCQPVLLQFPKASMPVIIAISGDDMQHMCCGV